jgi:hypothetical protein
VSNATTQTIVQIQIAGCTSYCQGVVQVQQASQSNSTLQSVGSAVSLASLLLTQPASAAPSQSTGGITQIQLGCLAQCFGTTTTDPSTAAITQLILTQLGSLIPPSGSSALQPAPATELNVVTQTSCQTQVGGSDTAQVQDASQTNATVQIVSSVSASTGSPVPETVDQTQQQTWQLQIGCLFYCVSSKQVQQAQQSTTTIQIIAAAPGASDPPGGTAVAVVQQSIWQMQIGCLVWCWDSTQLQQASTQSTLSVVAAPPSGPAPTPGPTPGPAPAPTPTPTLGPAPPTAGTAPAPSPDPGPAPAPGPASGAPVTVPAPSGTAPAPAAAAPPHASPPPAPLRAGTTTIRVLESPRSTGGAILTGWLVTTVVTPARGLAPAVGAHSIPVLSKRGPVIVRSAARPRRTRVRHAVLAAPIPPTSASIAGSTTDNGGGDQPIVALMLAVAAALALAATVRRRAGR